MLDLLKFDITADAKVARAFATLKGELGGVKGALAKVEDRARRAGKSMRNIGAGMTAGISAPLALIGRDSVKLFDTQVKAQAAVEQALVSTGGAAGRSAEELFRMASGMQAVTTYGDEDILRNVTAPLLTFTKVQGDTFDRAQAATLDMATLLQMDLKSAAVQVGKALNDPVKGITALSRAGVQFSDEQKEVIKSLVETGDVAAAQAVILGELETQFKGQAEAAAKTPLGQWQQLSNSIGDVKELLGEQIVPFLTPLLGKVKSAVQWFSDLSPEVKKNIVMFGGLAAAAGPVLTVLGLVTLGLTALAPALALLASPIALVLGGIALVAAGAYAIYQNWDGITAWFAGKWAAIKDGAAAGWEAIKAKIGKYAPDWLKAMWGGLSNWFSGQWAAIRAGAAVAWDGLKALLSGQYSASQLIHAGWQGIATWFRNLWGDVTQAFLDLWELIKAEVSQWPSRFVQFGRDMVSELIFGMSEEQEAAKTASYSIGQDIMSGMGLGIAAGRGSAEDVMRDTTKYLENAAKDELGIKSPSRVFMAIGEDIMAGLRLGIGNGNNGAQGEMAAVAGELTEGLDGVASRARQIDQMGGQIFAGWITQGKSLGRVISDLSARLADMLAQNAFTRLFSSIGLGGILAPLVNADGNVFRSGALVPFANGGVVGGPTLFPMSGGATGLMGEAGAEAIMPLTRTKDGKLGVRADGAGGVQRVELRVHADPGVVVEQVRGEMHGLAVEVVQAGIGEYDRTVLPRRFDQIGNDPRRMG